MSHYLDACRFGSSSEQVWSSLASPLQRVAREAIRRAPKHLDFALICGFRNQAEQNEAFRTGRSKKPWPEGKHNTFPSRAVDFRPASPFSTIDWQDRVRFARIAGFIEGVAYDLAIPVRLGLDWDGDGQSIDETFEDLGHIELL